jgi:hypothetical protein
VRSHKGAGTRAENELRMARHRGLQWWVRSIARPTVWTGATTWNSRTRSSSALTAVGTSSLQQASSFSSTTNNSRTSRSAARIARPSACRRSAGRRAQYIQRWRHGQPVRAVVRRRLCLSSQHRAGPCYAVNASSKDAAPQHPLLRDPEHSQQKPTETPASYLVTGTA